MENPRKQRDPRLIRHTDFFLPGQIGKASAKVLSALQAAIVSKVEIYNYLEIGSFKGKSLLPHVLVDSCANCVSIDLRNSATPDDRGIIARYDLDHGAKMLENINKHAGQQKTRKLATFTSDSSVLAEENFGFKFDLAFIDGEHTTKAVLNDVRNALPHMKENCILAFDDSPIIYPAFEGVRHLLLEDRPSSMWSFLGGVSVIVVGQLFSKEDFALPERFWITRTEVAEMHAAILP